MNEGTLVSCDEYWANGWRGPTVFRFWAERLHGVAEDAEDAGAIGVTGTAPRIHIPGTIFARLTDHHVHLGLIDGSALPSAGITHVTDLGWIPEVASGWLSGSLSQRLPDVRIAGAFLTCAGGYPSASAWAPAGSVREVAAPAQAADAVGEQAAAGASVIKVVLNSVAGPVLDDATLTAIVEEAHAHNLPVVVHVEGAGLSARALDAGADVFAHSPFTERLGDELIARMVASGMRWISTLDIHGWGEPAAEFDTALENVRRFIAAGGRMLYGTDLGNGPLPVGVNARELAALASAGLDRDALVRAIAGSNHLGSPDADERDAEPIAERLVWVHGLPPTSAADTAAWLASARGSILETLEDTVE